MGGGRFQPNKDYSANLRSLSTTNTRAHNTMITATVWDQVLSRERREKREAQMPANVLQKNLHRESKNAMKDGWMDVGWISSSPRASMRVLIPELAI